MGDQQGSSRGKERKGKKGFLGGRKEKAGERIGEKLRQVGGQLGTSGRSLEGGLGKLRAGGESAGLGRPLSHPRGWRRGPRR